MTSNVQITKAKDKNEKYVIQAKYGIKDGQYGVWEESKDVLTFVPKGSAVYIDKIINHLDTKEKSYILRFVDAEGNKVKVPFDRKELTEQGIMRLLAYGVQVVKQDSRALITSILNQEPDAKSESIHKTTGFTTYDRKIVFLGRKAIGVKSSYEGKLEIGKTGKYNIWKEMIETEVLGNIPLEFILAVACSGVFADYLQDKIQTENIIISLVGESSTGKSTAGLLLVSCGAKPSFRGDSLVLSFADTANALMATIPSSYPVLIDEGSLLRNNPTSLLYSLAMGAEKKRLNKDLEKVAPSYFRTAIAITSEKSLLSISDENSGLLVRILEIENVTWTKDAQSADSIKDVINSNYGWLVPKLAESIISDEEYREDEIKNLYWDCYDFLIEQAKIQGCNNSLMERACKQYAMILLSACYIETVMNIELDVKGIAEFIIMHSPVRESNCANIGSRALTYLMQYISENYSKFLSEDDIDDVTPTNCLGRICNIRKSSMKNGMQYSKRLYISETTLQKILKDRKFPDVKVILKKWKEEGVLKCEKDRYLSDIKIIGNLSVKGYVINLPDSDNSDNTNE